MRGFFTSLVVLFTVAAVAPAFSQANAVSIAQERDWATYSYKANGGTACYAMSVPQKKEPATLDHGDIFFFVSPRTGQAGSFEPQFVTSYAMQNQSEVLVTVGGTTFKMFTQGQSAWLEDPALQSGMIAAMRSGSDMKVSATSGRGNKTSYSFSLLGFTAAFNKMQSCR